MPCLVFVSHRTRDLQTTERMVGVLRKALNLTEREVLFTGQVMTSLAPGQSVDDTLTRELRDCKVVISLFTQASYGSVYQIMEMGAAWFSDKLIVTVVRGGDAGRLPQPLIGDQSVALDDRLHVVRFIETIGKFIDRTPEEPSAYEAELARLLSWTCRVEPFRRRLRTVSRGLAAALAATVFVSYLLSRQNVQGQVITEDAGGAQMGVEGATVFVDSDRSGVLTDAYGVFTFSVWNGFPKRHRVKISPPDTHGQYSTYWRGPWPLQSLWQDSVDFRYDPAKPAGGRFHVATNRNDLIDRALSMLSDVVTAASPSATPRVRASYSASVSGDAEVGFFIDTVSTPKVPGLPFFKADRAYFKVWVAGKQLDQRALAAPSPLTLGRNANLLPVESNRRSWIPVNEKPTKFANLFCRLPLDLVSLIDSSNHVIVAKDIVLQLSTENGAILGQFTITHGAPYAVSQPVELRDTSASSSTLMVRPAVRMKAVDLKWTPDDATIRAGDSLTISVAAVDPPLFPFEFSLTQNGLGGAAVENLPPKATMSPARQSLPLILRFASRPGKVKIVSHLPASLRRQDDDDADVVVTPRR